MDRQFKNLPYFKVASEGRSHKGICAVFGNIDACGDRIMPGAFAKTIQEGKSRVKHLWQHDFSTPPIASITELKEVSRDELPEEVLSYAPEATGGLMVAREYYENNDLAKWVLEAVDKGDITEMSFGFDIINSAESEENDVKIRNLVELKLFDTSDVLWGMNSATVAAGAKNALPIGVVVQHLQNYAEDFKAGRRNASADMKLIEAIHDSAVSLGYEKCMAKPDDEKAEAVFIDTSLSAQRLRFTRLKTTRGIYENQTSSA